MRMAGFRLLVLVMLAWTQSSHAEPRRLNNLVHELLNVSAPRVEQVYTFENPRDGFVWIEMNADTYARGQLRAQIDDQTPEDAAIVTTDTRLYPADAMEAMCHLPAGEHRLTITGSGLYELRRVRVHAIPNLLYWAHIEHNPYDNDYDLNYRWEWLLDNVLANYTHLVVLNRMFQDDSVREKTAKDIAQWRAMGRKVLGRYSIPYRDRPAGESPEEGLEEHTFQYYKRILEDPLVDGVMADEFVPTLATQAPRTEAWSAAILRVMKAFPEKTFHAAQGRKYTDGFDPLLQVAMALDNVYIAPQHYYNEDSNTQSEDALRRNIHKWSVEDALPTFEEKFPGIQKKTDLLVNLASISPNWSGDRDPDINFKKLLDIQLQIVASEPEYRDLASVGFWKSTKTNEEMIRFITAAFRHYFIEGSAEPFYAEPYRLTHLRNGGFAQGLDGWRVTETESGSVGVVDVGAGTGFSKHQGRRVPEGKKMLGMKVVASGAHHLRQQLGDLKPGKLYSLEFYTANRNQLAEKQLHPVHVTVDDGKIVKQRKLVMSHRHPEVGQDGEATGQVIRVVWNHHYFVFEAEGETAELTVTDWPDGTFNESFEGNVILYDFFQVQPYFE